MLGSTLYTCCKCGDGPKVYEHQSKCVLCHHDVCGYCSRWKDEDDGGWSPPVSEAQSDSFAYIENELPIDKLESPSIKHEDRQGLDCLTGSESLKAEGNGSHDEINLTSKPWQDHSSGHDLTSTIPDVNDFSVREYDTSSGSGILYPPENVGRRIVKDPSKVDLDTPQEKFKPSAPLNSGEVYTAEHNVKKAKPINQISPSSHPLDRYQDDEDRILTRRRDSYASRQKISITEEGAEAASKKDKDNEERKTLLEEDSIKMGSKSKDDQTLLPSDAAFPAMQNSAKYANQLGGLRADDNDLSIYEPSDVESIFSEDSVASSHSSTSEFRFSALSELIDLLLHHNDLKPLYTAAISKVGPDKFERNFKRFLKQYGCSLQHEASNQLELQAAKFVRISARQIAAEINLFLTRDIRKWSREVDEQSDAARLNEWLKSLKSQDLENLSDASDSDESEILEDTSFNAIENMKSFMVSGQAFSDLCKTFRLWLKLGEDQKEGPEDAQKRITQETFNLRNDSVLTKLESSAVFSDQPRSMTEEHNTAKNLTDVTELNEHHLPVVGDVDVSRAALALILSSEECHREFNPLNSVIQLFDLPVKKLGYLWQSSIPSGYVQVSWICRCGKKLQADFRETHQSAAVEFAKQAAGPTNSCTVSASNSKGKMSMMSSPESSSPESIISLSQDNISETPPSTASSDRGEPRDPIIAPGTKRYLLLCVNSGIHCINLTHVDITHTAHDEVLFYQIKAAYAKLRGRKAKNIFIVAKTMQYIKFELILRHKSRECVGNFETDSIPSEKEVLNGEYVFKPCPPNIGKLPIPPHIFMHSFEEPGDHTGSLAVERLPKKLREKLSCHNNQLNVPVGWGIYIVEGYNWKLLRWCVGSVIFTTFILTLLWCVLKDVQGGTGIGQYCTAAVSLGLAVLVLEQVKGEFRGLL